MSYAYDDENIFAKILRGEIPCQKVLETEHSLAFNDIAPQAPTHVLVIPKGRYTCYAHFAEEASDEEIVDFTRSVGDVCREAGVIDPGYRIVSNARENGHQDVPHLHVHVLAGRRLGPMLYPAS